MTKKRTKKKPVDQSEREAQLRRRMLSVVRLNAGTYTNGFVPFGLLAAVKDNEGVECDDDDLAARLISDLREWGLLEEAQHLGLGGTTPNNKHRRFKLTNKAFELWMQSIPPIPGVADDRVL